MTQEEKQAWREHPLTHKFFNILRKDRAEWVESVAEGRQLNSASDTFELTRQLGKLAGYVQCLDDILSFGKEEKGEQSE